MYINMMDGNRVQIGSDSRPFLLKRACGRESGCFEALIPVHTVKRRHVDGGFVYTSGVDGNPGALGYRCTKRYRSEAGIFM